MESLISSLEALLAWLQTPAIIGAAIAFCIGGYYLMFGGDQGRQKAIKWFVGGAIGLIVVLRCFNFASSVSIIFHSNILKSHSKQYRVVFIF